MASLPIKPLDSAGGYLRWKESLLLRVHTLDVAYVLSEARPAAGDGQEAAIKKWARDDAVCRGHMLAALSDRLLPDYARFATAAELWRALARTYDVKRAAFYWMNRFDEFRFERSTGEVFLEQLAHAEALGAAAELSNGCVAFELSGRIPLAMNLDVCGGQGSIWEVARRYLSRGVDPWYEEKEYEKKKLHNEDDGPMPEQTKASRKRARRRA